MSTVPRARHHHRCPTCRWGLDVELCKTKPPLREVPVPDKESSPRQPDSPPPRPQIEPRPPKPFWDVFVERIFDTGDDIAAHATRYFMGLTEEPTVAGLQDVNGEKVYKSNKPVVVVLGFGWAAHAFSKVVDIDKFNVVIVSPRNHFLFTPMLPSTAVGSVEFRSLLEPVRIANPYVAYFEGKAHTVDLERQVVICESTQTASRTHMEPTTFRIDYDYLIYGVGETPATFGIPGVRENCFFMKEVSDSVALRKRINEQFEAAGYASSESARRSLLRFVVVGGGPTGVEFAGTLSDFLFQDLSKRYTDLVKLAEVVLIQSGTSILPVFTAVLQERAVQNLERLQVKVMTDTKVINVTRDKMMLSSGEELGYGVCVWSTGNSARQLTIDVSKQLPAQAAFRGAREASTKIAVDDYMRIIGARNAFAAGDCSAIVRGPLPPTAQVAGQEGAYIGRVVNKYSVMGMGGLNSEAPSHTVEGGKAVEHMGEFNFLSLGIMAYIGQSKAVMQVDMDAGINIWGAFAFFLWRSVYITKQVSMRNRVLILFDWLKTRVFGRDISLF